VLLYHAERALCRFLVLVVLRRALRVTGRERIPRTGPALVVSNHVSLCDPALVGPFIRRPDVYFMAKSDAFRKRWHAYILRGYNAFPVVRQTADRPALRHALDVLASGHVLVMFPEGSRSSDHKIARPHAGVGFIARHSGVPVIPAAIWGTENVMPKDRLIPRHAMVHLTYGEPFHLPERNTDGSRMSHQQSTDYMMSKVAELLPEEYRGVYGDQQGGAAVSSSPAA
jgi:1-acyl-sn-glycerol-3-phosphate acyltransferase